MNTEALHAIRAAKHWTAWGTHAARRYCSRASSKL